MQWNGKFTIERVIYFLFGLILLVPNAFGEGRVVIVDWDDTLWETRLWVELRRKGSFSETIAKIREQQLQNIQKKLVSYTEKGDLVFLLTRGRLPKQLYKLPENVGGESDYFKYYEKNPYINPKSPEFDLDKAQEFNRNLQSQFSTNKINLLDSSNLGQADDAKGRFFKIIVDYLPSQLSSTVARNGGFIVQSIGDDEVADNILAQRIFEETADVRYSEADNGIIKANKKLLTKHRGTIKSIGFIQVKEFSVISAEKMNQRSFSEKVHKDRLDQVEQLLERQHNGFAGTKRQSIGIYSDELVKESPFSGECEPCCKGGSASGCFTFCAAPF